MRIKSGPSQGREFPLRPGSVVGRADVEIHIDDSKMSGRHARVDMDADSNLVLVDLGSTNGLRVEDKRLAKVSLTPGIVILIGKTAVEILPDVRGKQREAPPPLPADDDLTRAPTDDDLTRGPDGSAASPKYSDSWSEFFSTFLASSLEKIKSKPKALMPFDPPLILSVFRGVQAGTKWELGYGPRNIGLEGLEFPLFDNSAPNNAFSVKPKGLVAQFSTEHASLVLLNGKSVSSEQLKEGDVISLGETSIRVSYKE